MGPEHVAPSFETRVYEVENVVIAQITMRALDIFPDPTLDAMRAMSKEMGRRLTEGRRAFIFDVSSYGSLETTCIAELLTIWRQIRDRGGQLRLVVGDKQMSLWKRIRLGEVCPLYSQLDDAVADSKRSDRGI